MNKKILGLLGTLMFAAAASAALADYEPYVPPVKETPLMVIRFDQPTVIYKQTLYDTLSKAMQIKPSVQFEIVSVAKISNDKSTQKEYKDTAAQNTSKVLNALHEMKVPDSQYTVKAIVGPVKASEVRIYAH